MEKQYRNYVLVFVAGALWGTVGVFVKFMQSYGSTSNYTSFLRVLFGGIILVVLTLIKEGPKAFKLSKNTMISCVLLGVFTQGIFNLSYNSAINTAGMALASVLLYTAPVFTSIVSKLFLRKNSQGRNIWHF